MFGQREQCIFLDGNGQNTDIASYRGERRYVVVWRAPGVADSDMAWHRKDQRVESGVHTLSIPAQPVALPGFAFITSPSPTRSRRRYIPVALACVAAGFLLYGVMDENHSTRVNIAKHAQVDNVRIDPDHLPVA